MIASELINHMIPPLKLSDSAYKAITWMEELRVNELPVVDHSSFKGLLSEELIFIENSIEKPISDYVLRGQDCFVYENQHLYEVVKIATDRKLEVIAVLDKKQIFLGVITLQDTLAAFAQSAAIQGQGAIIVLSLNAIDYSLAEIARLVESNNAKILGSSLLIDPLDSKKIKLTIKINQSELTHIAATLDRFGYKIIAKYEEALSEGNEQERLDILMRYLDT